MKFDYAILSLCANLEVSPSGYYDWQKRRSAPGRRAAANQTLAKHLLLQTRGCFVGHLICGLVKDMQPR
jgi:hypothetical protein